MKAHRSIELEIKRFWDDKYKVLGCLTILLGLTLAYFFWARPSVKNRSELQALSGRLAGFSFTDGSRGTHRYYLGLDSSPLVFQVPADFLGYFERGSFERNLSRGSFISIEFPKLAKIDPSKPIPIFSIYSEGHSYLYPDACIHSYNHDWYLSALFLVVGVSVFIARSAYLVNHPGSRVKFSS